MVHPAEMYAFLSKTEKKNVYIADLNAAKKSRSYKEAFKKTAKIIGDFTFVILDNAENGYWTYLVICNNPNWQGNKGFVFTGVGGALGLARHIMGLCFADTKYDPFFKKHIVFFDMFTAQVSNFSTIIGYTLQNFISPTNSVANYIGIGAFAGSVLTGVILGRSLEYLEKLQEEDPEKFAKEASQLSQFLVSKKFKRIEKIYNFFLNTLFGASFAYYFLDVLISASVNVNSLIYNSSQLACAVLYAGINAMGGPMLRLTSDSIYLAVRSWYTLFVIAMDADAEAINDNDNISNNFFYGMLGVTATIGLMGCIYHFFKHKEEYLATSEVELDPEQPALNERWQEGESTRLLFNSRNILFRPVQSSRQSNDKEEISQAEQNYQPN